MDVYLYRTSPKEERGLSERVRTVVKDPWTVYLVNVGLGTEFQSKTPTGRVL